MGSIAEAALTRGAKGVLFEIKSKCSLRNTKIDENVDEVLFFLEAIIRASAKCNNDAKKRCRKAEKVAVT